MGSARSLPSTVWLLHDLVLLLSAASLHLGSRGHVSAGLSSVACSTSCSFMFERSFSPLLLTLIRCGLPRSAIRQPPETPPARLEAREPPRICLRRIFRLRPCPMVHRVWGRPLQLPRAQLSMSTDGRKTRTMIGSLWRLGHCVRKIPDDAIPDMIGTYHVGAALSDRDSYRWVMVCTGCVCVSVCSFERDLQCGCCCARERGCRADRFGFGLSNVRLRTWCNLPEVAHPDEDRSIANHLRFGNL